MAAPEERQSAIDELDRIDYFLDQLARAVERGDVPRASYDALAPRYLARRDVLIGTITAAVSAVEPEPELAPEPAPALGGEPIAPGPVLASAPAATPSVMPRRERPAPKPVPWTTILLFLGAFLVIVASGLFAAVVWERTGPAFKLAFLGTLTVVFYAAGYVTRARFGLKAGGIALTAVASAMLLFDCWIVIDGYGLTGPYPWAVALLFCSLVYWVTEIAFKERFYGVIGAAAQIAWWWLLGVGLGVEAPVRLAGIAVVAAVWQVAAVRVDDDASARSLADVLEWAAPVVAAVSGVALLFNVLLIGNADAATILSTAVAGAAVSVVAYRTRFLPQGRSLVAAAAQLPFLVSVTVVSGVERWWMVGLLVAATAAYCLWSLVRGGGAFAVLALVAEYTAVTMAGHLVPSVSDATGIAVYAGLAVTWVAAGRLIADRLVASAETERRLPGSRIFGWWSTTGGFALLVFAALMTLSLIGGLPMGMTSITATEGALCAALFAAWAGASLLCRRPPFAYGMVVWSFFTVGTLAAWRAPAMPVGWHYLAILVVGFAWLLAAAPLARFYGIRSGTLAWTARSVILLAAVLGSVSEMARVSSLASWPAVWLTLATAAVFLWDALRNRQPASAAIASVVATVCAMLAGGMYALQTGVPHADLFDLGTRPWSFEGLAGAAAAVALCGLAYAVRRHFDAEARAMALAAALAGTVACAPAMGEARYASVALALAAGAWALATVVTGYQLLAGVSGALVMCSAAAALHHFARPAWVTVAAFIVLAACFNAPTATTGFGPRGRYAHAGTALAVSGSSGLIVLAWAGRAFVRGADLGLSRLAWLDIGWHGEAVALVALALLALFHARVRALEWLLYVGYGLVTLAVMAEFRAFDVTTAEAYSTVLALYVTAMGYLYARRAPERRVPFVTDLLGTVIMLAIPLMAALNAPAGPDLLVHTLWAIGLSLCAIAAGIGLKVRAYLYGGTAALSLVAVWRTASYLAKFWWAVLGVIGIAMLVIALTWERQRVLLSDAQRRMHSSFQGWR